MVTEYGMSSRIGPVALGKKEDLVFLGRDLNEQRNYSEQTAREVDEEVRGIIQTAFGRAHTILLQHKARLIMISERLIREETLEGPVFEALFNQPIEGEEYASPAILAGLPHMPRTRAGGLDEQSHLLPEAGQSMLPPPGESCLAAGNKEGVSYDQL
jgi:cell division protease FtsH